MYLYVEVCAHEWKAKEGISFPGAGLRGGCELTNVEQNSGSLQE